MDSTAYQLLGLFLASNVLLEVTSVPVVTNVTSVVTNTHSDQFHKPTTITVQMNGSHLADVKSEDHQPKEPLKVTLPPTRDDVTSASVDPGISALTSNIQTLQQQLNICEEQLRLKIGDKHPGLQRGPAVHDTVDEGHEDEDDDKEEEEEKDDDDVNDTTITPEWNATAAEDEPDDKVDTSRVSPEVEHVQTPAAVTKAVDDVNKVTSTQVKTGSTTAAAQVSEINRLSAILARLNHSLTECYKIHTNWNNSHLV